MPDESTICKLVRRLAEQPIAEISRLLIARPQCETASARAMRIDPTVSEADLRFPADAGRVLDGARALERVSAVLTAATCASCVTSLPCLVP